MFVPRGNSGPFSYDSEPERHTQRSSLIRHITGFLAHKRATTSDDAFELPDAAGRSHSSRRSRRVPTSFSRPFHHEGALDQGLASLQQGLGMTDSSVSTFNNADEPVLARPTGACASTLIYAPDMDGQADPGEVVWVHSPNNQSDGRERAIVILGHHERYIRGLLISTNDEHSTDNNWLEIGAGGWDMQGRPAWVRLDKIIEVPDHMIRRKGTVLPRRRFERIASRLRTDYNWR